MKGRLLAEPKAQPPGRAQGVGGEGVERDGPNTPTPPFPLGPKGGREPLGQSRTASESMMDQNVKGISKLRPKDQVDPWLETDPWQGTDAWRGDHLKAKGSNKQCLKDQPLGQSRSASMSMKDQNVKGIDKLFALRSVSRR